MRIIYQYKVTKDPNMPWNISDFYLITSTGAECLSRVTFEFQHRFMGGNMEVLFGDD